jgi:hypothetical protein
MGLLPLRPAPFAAQARWRVLSAGGAMALGEAGRAGAVRVWVLAVLLLVLPLFGQTFHYIKTIPALWALSKAWPILTLPLALRLLAGPRPTGGRQVMLSFLWLLLIPSFISQETFNQNVIAALPAQVKLLSILYFFSFLALLRWLDPSARELEQAILILALASFVILVVIWAVAPNAAYEGHYDAGDGPLLASDARGHRIRLPMFYGMLGLLYAFRRYTATWNWRWLVTWAVGFGLMYGLVRMRTYILGMAVMAGFTLLRRASPRARITLIALVPFALLGLFQTPMMASIFSTDKAYAFDVRYISTMKAIAFLGTDPFRWIFGVGTLSPVDPSAMMTYFNHFFFLADITWMGVIFEFGLVGALLIMALPLRGIWLLERVRRIEDTALIGALQDYLMYCILVSEMFPMTMAPGEITMIMAMAVWRLEKLWRPAPAWRSPC